MIGVDQELDRQQAAAEFIVQHDKGSLMFKRPKGLSAGKSVANVIAGIYFAIVIGVSIYVLIALAGGKESMVISLQMLISFPLSIVGYFIIIGPLSALNDMDSWGVVPFLGWSLLLLIGLIQVWALRSFVSRVERFFRSNNGQ
ncbi:hypothetical protein [Streptosporangium sp. NPDC087985]|uniref:SCO4225 family membrane protein n=1 Tax=Streptosporangium sp. NPDC087985 TaxID=3366196 RepID=UPI0037FB4F25